MCNYASFLLRPGLLVDWTESDSHEEVISRLGIGDSTFIGPRSFLRIEVAAGKMAYYTVDEDSHYRPSWYKDNENAYYNIVEHILTRLNPLKASRDTLVADLYAEARPVYNNYERRYSDLAAQYPGASARLGSEFGDAAEELLDEYWAERRVVEAKFNSKFVELFQGIPGYVPMPVA